MSKTPLVTRGRTVRRQAPLLLAGLLASIASPSLAQQAEAAEDGEILVIARDYVPTGSVTATKSDIPLIETPQSISVITRDQIDLLNFIDVQQAVRYTAGVSGENFGPDLRFDFINVRGFTPKQYIDGLAAPITTSIFSTGVDLYAFETLDILKGPSSVLYGNAPPGGIYNQVTRRPRSEFGGEMQVKYGTTDYKQFATFVTGPATDRIDGAFSLMVRDRDADRDFVQARRVTGAPAVTLKIGPETTLTGLLYYQYDEVEGETNGFLPVVGTLEPNPNGQIGRGTNLGEPDYNRYRRRQFGAGYDFQHGFTDAIRFRSNTKWSTYDENQLVIYGGGLGADNRTVSRFNFPYDEEVKSFATDNRVEANFGSDDFRNKLLVGVDYRNVTNFARFGFGFAPPFVSTIDLYDPVYNAAPIATPGLDFTFNNQRLKQTGVYGQDQIRIGDLYILVGGRYDWVKIRDRRFGTTEKQDKFTYRVGANYVTDAGIAPYISYATSFEPLLGTNSLTLEPFSPSKGRQIEGGVKFDARGLPDDIKLFATAAVYHIKQTNVPSSNFVTTPPIVTQSGEVKVKGAEFELVARFRDRFSINASYSYTDSEITESNIPEEIGARLTVTPKHDASLFLDYVFSDGALEGLGIGGGVRYASRSAGTLPSAFSDAIYADDPVLFDAIVRYDTPDWRFAVNGSNILDKKYVARCNGPVGCNFGAARQVIGTVTRKF